MPRPRSSAPVVLVALVAIACADAGAHDETDGVAASSDADPTTSAGASDWPAADTGRTDGSTDGSGSTGGHDTGVPTDGCFAPGVVPPTDTPAGFTMPSLDDERATYQRWGLTWAPEAEPDVPAQPDFVVVDVDIHGDTEGDDLWTSLMQRIRTGQPGYADRTRAWRRYFVEDYNACVGSEGANFCYDRDAFGADHLWGWGLVALAEVDDDAEALDAAIAIGETVELLWAADSPYGCIPSNGCIHYGVRLMGRHLLFMTRLAEVTDEARWAELRDRMIDVLLAAPEWDETYGTYFEGEWSTDEALGAGAYAGGARIQSAFMLGVLTEGMDHAYRATGNEELRRRMVAIADFVDAHGLDPTYDYTASLFGIVDGQTWHSYGAEQPVDYWDPVYTTALVNTVARGWRYTCEPHYYERARHFFERGNRGIYGEPTMTAAPDGQIHHFVDTVFDSSSGDFFYAYNKGELQYTYLMFDPQAP